MQDNNAEKDPFSWKYVLIGFVVLLALPLMHVILGWFAFYL